MGFIAVNNISVQEDYAPRMEELFKSRAGLIDTIPGFRNLRVLKPLEQGGKYLVVSEWDSEDAFRVWTGSEAFREGHKRAFEDMEDAEREGRPPPMKSTFNMYEILTT